MESIMTKTEYAEYLSTDRWKQLRMEQLADWPYCSKCGMPRWLAIIAYDQDLHVHHLSYRNLGKENEYDDLTPLCRRCHEIETFGRSDLRQPKQAICEICSRKHWNPYGDRCETCDALMVSSEDSYFIIKRRPGGVDSDPVWAITLRRAVSYAGNPQERLEAIDLALEILGELDQQARYEIEHPDEVPF
jgi:hypothetical protein